MASRLLNGRQVVDRADAAVLAHVKLSTLDDLYRRRARTGFPERIPGSTAEWYAAAVRDWAADHARSKQARLTTVDRSGDPDELVDTATAASILGYQGRPSLRHSSLWPMLLEVVDDQQELPSGRVRRRWKRRTVQKVGDRRTGSGGGRPVGTPRRPVDRSGDPDELLSAAAAAHVLGYGRAQALPDAVLTLADEVTPAGRGQRRRWRRRTLWTFADTHISPRS